MSRIGKTPIIKPKEVILEITDGQVKITGPKGELNLDLPEFLKIETKDNQILVGVRDKNPELKSRYGLFRSLLQNAITGVNSGWEKTLELVGVGYKAQGGGNELILNVGFTHQVKIAAPKNITFKITDNTKITVSGIDKKVVGETAAEIRAVKKPEPYKGKGIRYLGEIVRKKAGKAVKAVGAPA